MLTAARSRWPSYAFCPPPPRNQTRGISEEKMKATKIAKHFEKRKANGGESPADSPELVSKNRPKYVCLWASYFFYWAYKVQNQNK